MAVAAVEVDVTTTLSVEVAVNKREGNRLEKDKGANPNDIQGPCSSNSSSAVLDWRVIVRVCCGNKLPSSFDEGCNREVLDLLTKGMLLLLFTINKKGQNAPDALTAVIRTRC